MRIPDHIIDQVREATDIIEVISQYVSLKRRGKSYLGLCPFHTEKTPSFNVDPVKGFYHCFGCKAGGNVFTFVMQMERVGFTEAVRILAGKAGIHIELVEEGNERYRETEVLYHANRFASEFYEQCLHETRAGKRALDILVSRGFTTETVRTFHVGYSPNLWDGLIQKAARESLPLENLSRAGLIIQKQDGSGFYDRFRGRLMFPILNPSGRTVGFGGRRIGTDDRSPKYINSPETPVYQKSRILYGLHESVQGIRREQKVILVEGYTDVMQLHQNGFDYTVASSGTALTPDQAAMLLRYTRRILLLFDGDSAGFSAALRGLDILLKAGLDVRVISLPKGTDPDSFLKQNGSGAMRTLLGKGRSIVDFYLDRFRDEGKLESPEDMAEAGMSILRTIALIRDPLKRNLMVKDLSEKTGISEILLTGQIERAQGGGDVQEFKTESRLSARQRAERGLLSLLVEDPGQWSKPVFHFLGPESFQTDLAKPVIEMIHKGYREGKIPGTEAVSREFVNDPLVSRYIVELMNEQTPGKSGLEQFALDCIVAILRDDIKKRIDGVREKIRGGSGAGDKALQERYIELRNEWKNTRERTAEAWKKIVGISKNYDYF